ncbi:MAG: universal stress protein [Saprospiraceae bacterium]
MTTNWKRIMICLDLSAIDDAVVAFGVKLLSSLPKPEAVCLVHNVRYDFKKLEQTFTQKQVLELKDRIRKHLHKTYQTAFKPLDIAVEISVSDDNSTTQAIMNAANAQSTDVILMGKKIPEEGAGIVPQKLLTADLKKTPIFLVPSSFSFRFERLVGGVDASATFMPVSRTSKQLSHCFGANKQLVHVYKEPVLYFPYFDGFNQEKIDNNIKEKVRAEFRDLAFNQTDLATSELAAVHLVKGSHTGHALIAYCHKTEADLLVIARIGKTNLVGSTMGGVTRTMLSKATEFVVCIL